jgi:DNA processing protein
LIKDGAKLVETVDDIVDTLNQNRHFHLSEVLPDLENLPTFHALADDVDNARDEVLNALSAEPIEIGALVRATGIDLSVINIILVELELAGRLERHPGNSVSLIYGG